MNEIENRKSAAKDFAEGSESLEKFLLYLWEHGHGTFSSCSGVFSYPKHLKKHTEKKDAKNQIHSFVSIDMSEMSDEEVLLFLHKIFSCNESISRVELMNGYINSLDKNTLMKVLKTDNTESAVREYHRIRAENPELYKRIVRESLAEHKTLVIRKKMDCVEDFLQSDGEPIKEKLIQNKNEVNNFWDCILKSFKEKENKKVLEEGEKSVFKHLGFVLEPYLPRDEYERTITLNYSNIEDGKAKEIEVEYNKTQYNKSLYKRRMVLNPETYTLYKQIHDTIIQKEFSHTVDSSQ